MYLYDDDDSGGFFMMVLMRWHCAKNNVHFLKNNQNVTLMTKRIHCVFSHVIYVSKEKIVNTFVHKHTTCEFDYGK